MIENKNKSRKVNEMEYKKLILLCGLDSTLKSSIERTLSKYSHAKIDIQDSIDYFNSVKRSESVLLNENEKYELMNNRFNQKIVDSLCANQNIVLIKPFLSEQSRRYVLNIEKQKFSSAKYFSFIIFVPKYSSNLLSISDTYADFSITVNTSEESNIVHKIIEKEFKKLIKNVSNKREVHDKNPQSQSVM